MNEPTPPNASPSGPGNAALSRGLLGAVLLGAVVLALALMLAIASRNGLFERHADAYLLADNAAGLAPGTAVRMSGVRIGEVRTLQLQTDLKVRVSLRLNAEHAAALRSDARAMLVREQLRLPVLEVDAGRAGTPLNAADPRLAYGSRGTLTEMADEVRGRLVPILDDLKQLTGTLAQRQGEIDEVLRHAARASNELANTAATMHALARTAQTQMQTIGNLSQGMLVQGQATVQKVGGVLEEVDRSLKVLNEGLPGLMSRSHQTLDQLNAVARDTRTISATAAEVLPGVLRNAAPVVEDTRELVQGLKQSWPVKALLPAPPAAVLPVESHDAQSLRQP